MGGKLLPISNFCESIQDMIRQHFGDVDELFEARSFMLNSSLYSKGCCIPSGDDGDLITFNAIKHCFIVNDEPYCLVQSLKTVNYMRNLHAYKVITGDSFSMLKLTTDMGTWNSTALGLYHLVSDVEHKYVSLKYKLLVH